MPANVTAIAIHCRNANSSSMHSQEMIAAIGGDNEKSRSVKRGPSSNIDLNRQMSQRKKPKKPEAPIRSHVGVSASVGSHSPRATRQ